jgi:hypothetical protein
VANAAAGGPKRKLFLGLRRGLRELEFTVGDECVGGCVATLVVAVPRSAPEAFALPQVATSALFDPRAPFSKSFTASLRVSEQRSLVVALAVAAEGADAVPAAAGEAVVVAPGAAASLSVTVTGPGGAAVPDAEVTFVAVDQAVLALVPYALRNVTQELVLQVASSMQASLGDESRVAAGAVEAVFQALARRHAADPWLPVETGVSGRARQARP